MIRSLPLFTVGVLFVALIMTPFDAQSRPAQRQANACSEPTISGFRVIADSSGEVEQGIVQGPISPGNVLRVEGCGFGTQPSAGRGGIELHGAFPNNVDARSETGTVNLTIRNWHTVGGVDTADVEIPAITGALDQPAHLVVKSATGRQGASFDVGFVATREVVDFAIRSGDAFDVACASSTDHDDCHAGNDNVIRGYHHNKISNRSVPAGQDTYTLHLRHGWSLFSASNFSSPSGIGHARYQVDATHIRVNWDIPTDGDVSYQFVAQVVGPAGVPIQ